ncbi:tropomyosin [Thalictrum thalictroides]|uniref:Tropomyosin n=1 Tax=Thalictrum thalictroides TaxID=46969 RepID=A0A7J6WCY6_THATH|nr:tropomyosin [Thalictrum thalictroides]
MEEYLQNMKDLRFQMNDVEDQAAKISVEEQSQITSINALEIDLESAKSKIRSLKEETELMLNTKNQICSQILDKHKKMASLEAESYTLSQTLELIQQEKVSSSSKNIENRNFYSKTKEDLHAKLQAQQDWIKSHSLKKEPEQRAMDMNTLEEERKALLSDEAGEMEYLQTLQHQFKQLKGISRVIKCACGEQYKVEMVTCG